MRVAIALGASMGDRAAALHLACAAIRPLSDLGPLRPSRIIETPPAGGVARAPFLNAVVRIDTSLAPAPLFAALQRIERRIGRRRARRYADRVVDIDLLLYGEEILDTPTLTLPHPRIGERPFVLQPLREAWPEARDPRTGRLWSEVLSYRAHPVVGVLPAGGPRCRPAASWSPR